VAKVLLASPRQRLHPPSQQKLLDVNAIIQRLSELPLGLLYLAIGAISALENVFPPFPSDAVVAFGSFLAARGAASPYSTFAVCLAGNLIGASLMYWIGRRYGSGPFMHRLEKWAGAGAEEKMRRLYARYGLPALFISRFLPAVRALVPPFAGAMRLPPIPVALAVISASGIWFAFITWIAFRAGSNWEVLYAKVVRSGTIVGVSATVFVLLVAIALFIRSRRRRRRVAPPATPPVTPS
jgi:membrane protein DedA with SNARE-associated domain